MKEDKECRHVWHNGGTAKGISLTTPEFQDDVCVFLYCPKCLETTTLTYRINKERTHTDLDKDIIDVILKQQSEAALAHQLKHEMEILKSRVANNLTKLSYLPDRVQAIVSKLKFDTTLLEDLKSHLHEDHRPMVKMIIFGDLIN